METWSAWRRLSVNQGGSDLLRESLSQLTEGVEFIYNKIVNMLKANGVDTINPHEGDKFDDSVHEAIVAIPGEEDKKNTVKFTQFKGYKMGDTILRYAKVGVNV
jgi:molecular chaperone GrpE